MPELRNKPVLIRRVNLVWYPLALLPILLLGYAALSGWVPQMLILASIFLLFFWIFSFGFALWSLTRGKTEPRQ
jgi:hypothetical protein